MDTQAEVKIVDGSDDALWALEQAWRAEQVPSYRARGCEYVFEVTDRDAATHEMGVVVYCFGRDGSQNWSGAVRVGKNTTIAQIKRDARETWQLDR